MSARTKSWLSPAQAWTIASEPERADHIKGDVLGAVDIPGGHGHVRRAMSGSSSRRSTTIESAPTGAPFGELNGRRVRKLAGGTYRMVGIEVKGRAMDSDAPSTVFIARCPSSLIATIRPPSSIEMRCGPGCALQPGRDADHRLLDAERVGPGRVPAPPTCEWIAPHNSRKPATAPGCSATG